MADGLASLEVQLSVLARRLEHNSRNSELYVDIDRAGYLLARTIHAHGPSGVNQLATRLHLDGSTVTRQVAALEQRQFVVRSADPADARASIIELTDAGRAEMRRVARARLRSLRSMLAEWPDEDIEQFADLLERFNSSLTEPAPVRSRP